jgi:hypothetical protein
MAATIIQDNTVRIAVSQGDGAGTVGRGYRYGSAFLEVSTDVVGSK